MLRERDRPGAASIGLIDLTARCALDAGYHVVVEGIPYADHYGEMLTRLLADHRGPTHAYYLQVPFEQTLLRHATKPIAHEVGEAQLRDWCRELDLLPGGAETVIGADSTLPRTVDRITRDTGLAGLPALDLQSPVRTRRAGRERRVAVSMDGAGAPASAARCCPTCRAAVAARKREGEV